MLTITNYSANQVGGELELYRGDKEEGKQQLRERGSLDPALVETVSRRSSV